MEVTWRSGVDALSLPVALPISVFGEARRQPGKDLRRRVRPDAFLRRDDHRVALPLRDGHGRDLIGEGRSEEHTSELQSRRDLVCRLLLEQNKGHPAGGRAWTCR